jgi:hypothetical protein
VDVPLTPEQIQGDGNAERRSRRAVAGHCGVVNDCLQAADRRGGLQGAVGEENRRPPMNSGRIQIAALAIFAIKNYGSSHISTAGFPTGGISSSLPREPPGPRWP